MLYTTTITDWGSESLQRYEYDGSDFIYIVISMPVSRDGCDRLGYDNMIFGDSCMWVNFNGFVNVIFIK